LRFLLLHCGLHPDHFRYPGIITMTYGNVVAVSQKSIKDACLFINSPGRLHSAGIRGHDTDVHCRWRALALGHALMKGGAFIAVAVVGYMVLSDNKNAKNIDDISHFAGLGSALHNRVVPVRVLPCSGCIPISGFMASSCCSIL